MPHALAPFLLAAAVSGRLVQPVGEVVPGWQPAGPPVRITSIAVSPQRPATVYTTYAVSGGPSGAMRSDDFGSTWTILATSLPGDRAMSIAVDPTDDRHLFAAASRGVDTVGATRIYDSFDAGVTWSLRADVPETVCEGFVFDRGGAAVYLLGCGGTVYTSLDNGLTWTSRLQGIGRLAAGASSGTLFGVGRYGGSVLLSLDFGASWRSVTSASGECGIRAFGVDASGDVFHSSCRPRMIFNDCPGLFRSQDLGGTWKTVGGGSFQSLWFDPVDPKRIYGLQYGWACLVLDLFTSSDGGATWSPLGLPEALQVVPSASGDVLYAATATGLRRMALGNRLVARDPQALEPRPTRP